MYNFIYVNMLINVYRVHFCVFRVKSNIVDQAHLYTSIRACVSMYVHTCTHIHTHKYIHKYIHNIHIHIYIHIYVHI